ncbi:flagellin [Halorubrum ezzemoulense DSM 17463]|uniref:Flagellin n=1 Tax=Halorubrum ezzemoulense DSM 17463 TaxID=1121945 RepID=A0A1X4GKB0_HALEZ|nr:archaellin/type IV pilin N-terminal domain-containing protein [Halorubrum ezzemoulense]MDB2265973.1 flagellin [Halorubrum ezzemoulense]OSO97631.1 flagellin [Halorubrum ezzemoulense DSM 17463]PHQ46738.1 flagellin [Halorubrum sp. C3]
MFETILDEEERGQVGIGTLIVFIAMVLVAAIAAGVLINTAGFLQTQAEATGEESTSQVSDRLQVVSQSGYLSDTSSGTVDHLQFVLAQSPGADNIDLDEVSAELIGEDGQETFQLSSDEVDINIFTGGPNNVMTDTSDRAEVSIALTNNNDITGVSENLGYTLEEGDTLTFTFTTPSGATTTTEIRIPSTVVDNSVRL